MKVIGKQQNWGIKEMDEASAIEMITDINISDRKAIELIQYLKKTLGKGIFTKSLKKALANRKTIFKEYMNKEKITFINSDGDSFEETLVYVNDLEAMANLVCDARGIDIENCIQFLELMVAEGGLH